ncbi:hypothetical protein HD554DRAFT_2040940 [Boletus coccyginus]|nr:hypothetical protein HD554DRAFT_2040940 [Boletus coccyginus]
MTGSTIDFEKAKYELVGRKLTCFLHPFGSPRTTINVRLKVKSSCEVLSHALGLPEELSNRMKANELQNICTWIKSSEYFKMAQLGPQLPTGQHAFMKMECMIQKIEQRDSFVDMLLFSWAFPKGHGCFNDLDSNDDMAKIHAQHACLSKKATHPSRLEIRAAEAIKFATPPPETTSIPSSEDPSNEIQSHSSISILSILSAATAAAIKSDLSPCMSDNEAESTQIPVAYKTTDVTIASTSMVASLLSAPALLSHLSTGPVELKKGYALATKKSHCWGGKKSNRF